VQPNFVFTNFERQQAIFFMLTLNEGTKPLGFRPRLALWLKSINVRNMILVSKDYVKELMNMELFPNLNFA